jgi:ATP-dependent RNA helicase DDX24/MAK5
MSIQKQERLLSYKPTIIIATPGRLWELLTERLNPYLNAELPLLDILVLDEADRMIDDGHFKELKLILDFIYTKRVDFKRTETIKAKMASEDPVVKDSKRLYKEEVLKHNKKQKLQAEFGIKNIEKHAAVDLSEVVDLYDEEGMLEEINPDELIIEADQEEEKEEKSKNPAKKRN